MKINEQDVAIFGAHLTMDYTVGGYEVDSSAFMGRKRSTFVLLNHTTGFKEIVVPIVFDKKPVTVNKDRFEALAFSGKVELEMDDGQLFTAYLSEIGETTYIHPDLIESEYVFIGVRHGRKRTVHANTLSVRVLCLDRLHPDGHGRQNGKTIRSGRWSFRASHPGRCWLWMVSTSGSLPTVHPLRSWQNGRSCHPFPRGSMRLTAPIRSRWSTTRPTFNEQMSEEKEGGGRVVATWQSDIKHG
ncbi:MAG: hypothetical protein ACLSA6_00250 [Holdemania massiliensis]